MNELTCPICSRVLEVSKNKYMCKHCNVNLSPDAVDKIECWKTAISTGNDINTLSLTDNKNVKYLPFEIDTPKARYAFLKFVLFHSKAFKNIGLREIDLTVEPLLLPIYVANDVKCKHGLLWHDTVHVDWEAGRGTRTYSGKNDYLMIRCGNCTVDNIVTLASSESMFVNNRHFTYESVLPYDFSKSEILGAEISYKTIEPNKNFEYAKYDLKANAIIKVRSAVWHKEHTGSGNDISVDSEDIAHFCDLNGKADIVYVPVYKVTFSDNGVTYGGYVNGQTGKAFGLIPNQTGSLRPEVTPFLHRYSKWLLTLLVIAAVCICSTHYKTGWFSNVLVGAIILFVIFRFWIINQRLKSSRKLENTLMGTASNFVKIKQMKQTFKKKIKL